MSETVEKPILRDFLALERTKLANERTFLAYIRTSLYFLLGGLAFIKLEEFENAVFLGYISLGISILLIVLGMFKFLVLRKRIKKRHSLHNIEKIVAGEKPV
jgi:putative membrane protein